MTDVHPLNDPVNASLRGAHAHLARQHGSALTYLDDVATFVAIPTAPTPQDWDDLAHLLGPGGLADLFSSPATPPPDWTPVFTMDGLQMVAGEDAPSRAGAPWDDEVIDLGPGDLVDLQELVAAARPGPFWNRTPEMGTYLGIRHRGRLVAMAGTRLRPPGWSEISAVATHPSVRGQGLAASVVRELVVRIAAEGDQPFLHVASDNDPAIQLYKRLGFEVRRTVTFRGFTVPPDS